ncbi:MAG: hypothetical protein CMI53_02740 [Parcubacteria group bacterium]|nr:hypothetical protein [Parcubacteria group bacterium]|tara:strand:+ start:543 stop:878 length:336 start_codon:yes stop_codon:yes gene_type:complete
MGNNLKVCSTSEIPKGEMRVFSKHGVQFLIYNKNNEFFALYNHCPHADGSLGEGMVNEEGYIMCPLHSWKFHHKTGKAPEGQDHSVPTFDIEVRNNEIYFDEQQLMDFDEF